MNATVQHALAAGSRVFEVLDSHQEVHEAPDASPLPRLQREIEYRDVGFRYSDAEAAVRALGKAAELAPNFPAAPLNLGIAQLRAGRKPEGIAALRRAQALAPENPAVLISLADALASADSTAAAIEEYLGAIEIDPTSARAHRGLGLCQIQKKSWPEAVSSLKQATSLDGNNADGWAMLGQAYLGLNDIPRAKQAAERCLAIKPGHETGKSVLNVARQARGSSAGQ